MASEQPPHVPSWAQLLHRAKSEGRDPPGVRLRSLPPAQGVPGRALGGQHQAQRDVAPCAVVPAVVPGTVAAKGGGPGLAFPVTFRPASDVGGLRFSGSMKPCGNFTVRGRAEFP